MSLLFDLEALMRGRGIETLQRSQRDFNPYLIHFTNWTAMEKVRSFMDAMGKGENNLSDLATHLKDADRESRQTLRRILDSQSVKANKFHSDYKKAVCLTECTLAGALAHSARFGRYGLVFEKTYLYGRGARPVAYVDEDVRGAYWDARNDSDMIRGNLLHVNLLRPPGQSDGTVQEYTHEREWRCPKNICADRAVALIVAKTEDCQEFVGAAGNRPILPLDLLYQMGL